MMVGCRVTRTSIHASSFRSPESSLTLPPPLTACLLLGGARSSTALTAGLFLSSILTKVAGRGDAVGEVAIGMRRVAQREIGRGERENNKKRGLGKEPTTILSAGRCPENQKGGHPNEVWGSEKLENGDAKLDGDPGCQSGR